MSNKVEIKENDKGEAYFDLEEILKGTNVNIKDVHSYKILEDKSGQITLVLFDKDENQIIVGAEDEKE